MVRTRLGARNRTQEQALKLAAARGALAGHTSSTQSKDLVDESALAEAGALQRAAANTAETYKALEEPAKAFRAADREVERSKARLPAADVELEDARLEAQALAEAEIVQANAQPRVAVPPLPSDDEYRARVREAIPGYHITLKVKIVLFSGAGLIEALFAGILVSDVGSIGIAGLSAEINATLPWVVGAILGALIPLAAERVAHAESRAPDPIPWYQRYATIAVIATPAILGLARAIHLCVETSIPSGFLGLGIALLMTALALVGAVVGHREREGEIWNEWCEARRIVRDEIRVSQIPPPSPEAIALATIRDLRKEANANVAKALARRNEILQEEGIAEDEREQALATLLVEQARSAAQATEEAGLADGVKMTFAQRRAAVLARYLDAPPWSYGATDEIQPTDASTLPKVQIDDLIAESPGVAEGSGEEQDDDA